MTGHDDRPRVTVERDGAVLLIGLDRPEKRNAADLRLLRELASAYGELHRDPALRVGVVHAHGEHFSAGLDLADIGPRVGPQGLDAVPEDGLDPWGVRGERCAKPVVVALKGVSFTLSIELALASEIAVASADARFAQLEVARAILPFGGATLRFPARSGWGDAMRWMLTGDEFDAAEALRLGLVQEVVEGDPLPRALELARRIAEQAPLAVQATLRNARIAAAQGERTAAGALPGELAELMASEDARIGVEAFLRRERAEYLGR